MKKLLSVIVLISILSPVCAPAEVEVVVVDYKTEALEIQAYYQTLVNSGDKKVTPNLKVIEKTLEAIDHTLPTYFPEGPFTREDFIAIAMLESDFHQYELGTSGERGIFQIMKHNVKGKKTWERAYNIEVNTQLAMKVMSWKHQEHPESLKMTVIAYNGIVHDRRGRLNEKYWRTYLKHKKIVESVLVEK
jgi:hypothetical protein